MKVEWFFVGEDIQIQTEGEFDIEELYEGLEDLVTVNEINPTVGCDYLAYDSKVFELLYSDLTSIRDRGIGRAYYIGELKDFISLDVQSDIEFAKWYWGEDYLTELYNGTNKTKNKLL
jgi:hypothetical protein